MNNYNKLIKVTLRDDVFPDAAPLICWEERMRPPCPRPRPAPRPPTPSTPCPSTSPCPHLATATTCHTPPQPTPRRHCNDN